MTKEHGLFMKFSTQEMLGIQACGGSGAIYDIGNGWEVLGVPNAKGCEDLSAPKPDGLGELILEPQSFHFKHEVLIASYTKEPARTVGIKNHFPFLFKLQFGKHPPFPPIFSYKKTGFHEGEQARRPGSILED
jgi:hypothetical protein